MKTSSVRIPITGVLDIEVEAESEEAAIEKGLEEATLDNLAEWEATREIVWGNVFYGHTNNAEAMEV